MKVAAIVPALNEEKTIAKVLEVLLKSKDLDEIIVVDDGSTDRTAEISRKMGAKVISLPKKGGSGKGNAMKQGVKNTDADIIVFFDADLKGFCLEHISSLVQPILKNQAVMSVGLRDRWQGLPELFVKIDPLLAIAGERAMKRVIFENIPQEFIKDFWVETVLNYYCLVKNLPVRYVRLKGLDILTKERKQGFFRGFWNRLEMIWEIVKVRVLIRLRKKEFKRNV